MARWPGGCGSVANHLRRKARSGSAVWRGAWGPGEVRAPKQEAYRSLPGLACSKSPIAQLGRNPPPAGESDEGGHGNLLGGGGEGQEFTGVSG